MRGSLSELLVIAIVAGLMVLFFGAKKLPELAKAWKESKDIVYEPGQDSGIEAEGEAEAITETADVQA